MATWNQNINAGGFLAGIGASNTNAPQAGDADAALSFIRQNNEIKRSGADNVGLTLLQGLAGVNQAYQQAEEQQRGKEFQQAYASAYASGDRNAMRQLATQYPEQFDRVRQGMQFVDDDHRNTVGSLAASARLASSSPDLMGKWLQSNASELARVGVNPTEVAQMYQQNPQQFGEFVDHLGMAALGPDKYFDVQDKIAGRDIDRGRLAETIRSNQAGEVIQRRGQDISAATARRGQDMMAQRARDKGSPDIDNRTVQLADGRTVTVGGKLHGSGANAFYEGVDNAGNMVRVPANAIAAPGTSAASAQNFAMKKDIDLIANADPDKLDFMTGLTGSNGEPAVGADLKSRFTGKEQRQLFNSARRIQGRMQNQGVAAARDMGASGINTVAEAKMYFQGMPQVDYSGPEALQQSIRDIRDYTNNYNQQYNVNVGKAQRQQQQPAQPAAGSNFSSLWGD